MAESDLSQAFHTAETEIAAAASPPGVDDVRARLGRRRRRRHVAAGAAAFVVASVVASTAVALHHPAATPSPSAMRSTGPVARVISTPMAASAVPTPPPPTDPPVKRVVHPKPPADPTASPTEAPSASPPTPPCVPTVFANADMQGRTVVLSALPPADGDPQALCPGQQLDITIEQYTFLADGSQTIASVDVHRLSPENLTENVPLAIVPNAGCTGDVIVLSGDLKPIRRIAAGAGNPYPATPGPGGGTLLFRPGTPCG